MAQTISSGYIYNQGTIPVTATPLTIACWFNAPNITGAFYLASVGDFDTDNYFRIEAAGNVASDPVRAAAAAGGSLAAAATSVGYSANTWSHACGVFTSSTSRTAYLNGGNAVTNATNRAPSGIDYVAIGNVRVANAWTSATAPIVAEVGVWNVALNVDEIASLSKGFRSDSIRPQSLVFYAPLVRNINDIRGGLTLTSLGTTEAQHPRIY